MVEPEKRIATASALGVNHHLDARAEYIHGNLRQHDPRFGRSSTHRRVLQLGKRVRFTSVRLPMLSSLAVSVADVHAEHRFAGGCANLHSGSCSLWHLSIEEWERGCDGSHSRAVTAGYPVTWMSSRGKLKAGVGRHGSQIRLTL